MKIIRTIMNEAALVLGTSLYDYYEFMEMD